MQIRDLAPLLAVALALGCVNTPSLEVSVDWGADDLILLKDDKRVDLYEIDGLTCDEIKFGKTLIADIAKFRITTDTDQKQGSLGSFTTDGPKVIIAKGFKGDRIVRIGCAEVSNVSGATKIAITTVRTNQVNAVATPIADGRIGVKLTVTDFESKPVTGAEIQWSLFGPAAAVLADPVTTVGSSIPYDFTSVLPTKTGPFALQPRVEWNLTPVTALTGFAGAEVTFEQLDEQRRLSDLIKTCAVARGSSTDSQFALYCLQLDKTQTPPRWALQTFRLQSGGLSFDAPSIQYFATNPILGFVPVILARVGDRLVAVSKNGLVSSLMISNATRTPEVVVEPQGTITLAALAEPVQVLHIPKCGADSSDGLAVRISDRSFVVFRRVGANTTTTGLDFRFPPETLGIVLQGAGCVTNSANGTQYQAIVASTSRISADNAKSRMLFTANDGTPFGGAFAVSQFPAAGLVTRDESRVLSVVSDIKGIAVQESVLSKPLQPATSPATLLVRRSVRTAAPPTRIVSGTFDDDSSPDLAWLIRGADSSTVQVMLDRPVNDEFLTGTYEQPLESFIDIADMDGSGTDDIVTFGLVDDEMAPLQKNLRISVMRMGVAPK